MLSRIFVLFCILQIFPVTAQVATNELPVARLALSWRVEVKNPAGIFIRKQATSGKTFRFDDECTMVEGGILTPVAERNGKVLVRYLSAKGIGPVECPNGTLAFIPSSSYRTMKSVRKEGYTIAQELEMEEVERILASSKK